MTAKAAVGATTAAEPMAVDAGAASPTAPASTAVPPPVDARPTAATPDRKSPKSHKGLVRDGFTMPQSDFALVATLKSRALAARREAKKSELLRAGLHALAALQPDELVAALERLEPVKTGRPRKR